MRLPRPPRARALAPATAALARTLLALLLAALLTALLGVPTAVADTPQDATSSASGAAGQRLTVTPAGPLDPAGQQVTIEGSGYDVTKGIYVAFCIVPKPGELPSPCGGGVDTAGASGSSVSLSSNPPSYAKDLVTAYGPDGTFRVTMHLAARLTDEIDCTTKACAVVTRADHTRSSDRSQDVVVPVSFEQAGADGANTALWVGVGAGGGMLLLALMAGALVLARRRGPDRAPHEARETADA